MVARPVDETASSAATVTTAAGERVSEGLADPTDGPETALGRPATSPPPYAPPLTPTALSAPPRWAAAGTWATTERDCEGGRCEVIEGVEQPLKTPQTNTPDTQTERRIWRTWRRCTGKKGGRGMSGSEGRWSTVGVGSPRTKGATRVNHTDGGLYQLCRSQAFGVLNQLFKTSGSIRKRGIQDSDHATPAGLGYNGDLT